MRRRSELVRPVWPLVVLLALGAAGCERSGEHPGGPAVEAGPVPVQERFMAIDGYRVLVREYGHTDGPPVMLIHGFMRNGWSFAPLLPVLEERYHVVVPDLPGHGESYPEGVAPGTPEGAPPFPLLADVIEKVADGLDLPPFAILGHSLGGVVGAQVALAHPDRVRALVLLESTPTYKWPKATECLPKCAPLLTFEDDVIEVNRRLHSKALYDALWKEYVDVDATAIFARRDLPILWMMNTDGKVDRDDFLKRAASVDPEAPKRVEMVTFDRRGHFPDWTATGQVRKAVTEFFARTFPPAP
jgi:pimeloyl-ACP methyl ester carboxylesterase